MQIYKKEKVNFMKKKLLAIIVAIAMLAALFVPMLAVSANTEAKTIVFEIGEITYNDEFGEIEVPLNIVENNSDIYAAEIVLENENGLVCSTILEGTIKDQIDKGGRVGVVDFGFNYTPNPAIAKLVIDSAEPTVGVATTGLVATFCYTAPEGFEEADMAGYAFKFGAETLLVAFDGSYPVAVLGGEEEPACEHTETEEVIVTEATCTEPGTKNVVCKACEEVIDTVAIDALGHGAEKEVVVTEPQIGVAGSKEIRCSVCDAVLRTEEIPALEEDPITPPVNPDAKTIVFEIGELTYNTQFNEIEVPLYIVENNSDIYAAELVLENENGLVCSTIMEGTIKDEIDKGGRVGVVEFGFNYTPNPAIAKLVIDSAEPTVGVATTGLVATFCYTAPEGFEEADMADYVFKFGAETLLVAFDGSYPVAVLKDKDAPIVPPACEHTETKEVVTKEATCTEAGSKNIVCVACEEVIDTVEIPVIDHTFEPDPENDVAPTCTEGGKKAYKCECGETKFEDVPALGHGAEKEVVVTEPQIGVPGLKEIRCSVCDAVLRTEEIPALEEDPITPPVNPDAKTIVFEIGELTYNTQFNEIEVPLYIVENNSDIYAAELVLENENGLVCSTIMEGTIEDEIDKGGREGVVKYKLNYLANPALSKLVVDSAEPTKGVSTTGLVATWCFSAPAGFEEADMADYVFKFGASTLLVAFDGTYPVAVLKDKEVEPPVECDHAETKEVVTKEATCTDAGSKNIVCVACEEVIDTVEIPALGHGATKEVVTKEATCTEAGSKDIVCTVCDAVLETKEIAPLGHVDTKEVVTKEATCTEAGSKNIVCEACGEVIDTVEIAALGHDWVEDLTKRENPTLEKEGKQVFECSRECGVEAKVVTVAKLAGEVKNEEAGFVAKTEEGKGLPADIAPAKKDAPAKEKLPEGLKALTSIVFDTDFTELIKDVVAEIVIDLSKYIDVKDYNAVSIGVVNKEGKVEVIEAKFDGSKVTFNGNVDGEIVLLVEDKVEEVKPTPNKPGDDFSAVLYIAFALVAAGAVVVIGKKRITL